ncbi:DUF6463 family protein [Lysobacter koreensis]|uniref:DUF6463 family protein n=1 Tax=Lysobacter koreensis TaxID=266122 RepID=A0ABW2YPF0_9GAMM
MKKWIGKWVMFVALGHTVVGITFFGSVYRELLASGLYNSITSEKAGLAAWFALFGAVLFVVGMLLSALEANGSPIPRSVGVALLLLTVLGVVLMPVSGFWLMFPVALLIVLKKAPGVRPLAI